MGEMADYTLELAESEELYFDNVMYDEELDSYIGHGHKRPPTCKFCGKKNLAWGNIIDDKNNTRWFLHEQDGSIHDCPKNPLSVSLLKKIAAARRTPKTMTSELIGTPFENYTPPSWDEWFIKIMYLVASKSKDPKTKIGAVLVRDRRIISTGYNGLCRGVNDDVPSRLVRPAKYNWFEHGERNAIFAAARHGIATEGTTMYTNGVPCTDCARAVIQAGVEAIVVHKPYEDLSVMAQKAKSGHGEKWAGHNTISMEMFNEAGVMVSVFDKPVGAFAYFDGNQYVV